MPIQLASFLIPKNGGSFFLLEDLYLRGGFRVVATLADRDALNASTLKGSMLVLVQDDGLVYQLSTDLMSWTQFAGMVGPKGDQGIAGPQGEVGAAGGRGLTGADGAKGDTGLKGDKGDTGAKGDQGLKGDQGIPGTAINAVGLLADRTIYDLQGANFVFLSTDTNELFVKASNVEGDWSAGVPFGSGLKGAKGDPGDRGLTGPKGDTGTKGDKGDVGLTGATGDTGPASTVAGPKGDKGDTGLTGPASTVAGPKGDTGSTGLKGDTGPKGDKGDTGLPGATAPHAANHRTGGTDALSAADIGAIPSSGGTAEGLINFDAGITYKNVYAALANAPDPTAHEGMFIKVTDTGKPYFAKNGTWVELGVVPTGGQPFDISFFIPGTMPNAGELVGLVVMTHAVTLPLALAGSSAAAKVAPSASTTYQISVNGVSKGTVTFAAASKVGTFALSAAQNLVAGDTVEITTPSVVDAQIANVVVTLQGKV